MTKGLRAAVVFYTLASSTYLPSTNQLTNLQAGRQADRYYLISITPKSLDAIPIEVLNLQQTFESLVIAIILVFF
jgi:hypothetical protein